MSDRARANEPTRGDPAHPRARPWRLLWTWLTAWFAILAVLRLTVPPVRTIVWALVGASSVVAMVVGIVRHRPRHPGPWVLFAAAVACLAVGDVTAEILENAGITPFPSGADVVYLVMYVLIAAGIVWLYRLGAVRRDVAGILDALTLTTGVGLLSWVFLIAPYVKNPDLGPVEKIIVTAYPLGDLLLIAAGAAVIVSMRATVALRLLLVGGVGLLASDIAYGLIQLYGAWRIGTPVDLGWVLFYLCWALAALHPSMRELTEPKLLRERQEGVRASRWILLGLASLIAPVVLAVEVLMNEVDDGLAIAILSAVLSALILIRLSRAVASQRRSALREQALRRAGAELLATTDARDVSAVVSHAVDRLLPSGEPYRVVVDLDGSADRPEEGAGDRTVSATRSADGDPAPALVYTSDLPAPVVKELDGFEVTLRCDLAMRPGDKAGTLYLAADETLLTTLQESAQVLAGEAGLTLQRITLGAEIDRRNSEAYFRTLVLNAADVILILDDSDRIRYASPSAAALLGTTELVGAALPELVAPESARAVHERLARVRGGGPDQGGDVWRVRRPDGEALVEASCRDLHGEPTVDGVVVTLRDVTESRRMQDELYRRATTDALTGLPNHDVFVGAVQRSVDGAREVGARAGVVIAGLDEFKLVNNTMGHHAGDEVLTLVGRRLTEATSAHDVIQAADGDGRGRTVARLGSDEFAVHLSGVRDQADIDRAVAAVMGCFAEPFVLAKGSVTLRASVGVAMTSGETLASELLRQADIALGVAKDAGRNRMVQYEDSLHTLVSDRLQMRGELERAVAEGSFVLEFQPIVALPWRASQGQQARHTVGFEALVRWQHPEKGTLGPGQFITLAEESGLIVPLGTWVLHHSIRTAGGWPRSHEGEPQPYVSVNVSTRQLRTSDFVGRVLDELAATRLSPDRLVLEVTESMLVQEASITDELARLREHGVKVAIDDFGTGFSSLSYLRQLPVDVLKLDKSFADTLTTSSEQRAVVETISQLAQTLHLHMVAEGIETEQEVEALAAAGCGFGQGYVVSRPIPHTDVAGWLRAEAPDHAAATG